ncbi:integral membrane protein [Venturia nashicola]|uniref:Integral membrane protein n=1 Tax=Venturia nashicola TaxID=86259 RepID=A0A4Z1NZY4_9PEZI|nr:integral membrane protein [Venturia nashicola]TLD25777.1 integral membrane protein [Venturia nashicola]
MPNVNGTLTMIPPPDGYEVDFANPQRRLVIETYILFALENVLALIFLVQRLYTKVRLMKKFQIDDVFIIVAWALSVGTQACLVAGFVTGSIGVHAWEISLEQYGFYSRWAVWITIFVCTGVYTGIFFSVLFACKPFAASWDPTLLPTAICVNRGAIYIATAVMGVVTDVVLFAIPIPTIWGLQMPTKQKIGLTAMFAVGSITMITSIVRLIVLIPSLTETDQTWVIAEGSLWIIVEANIEALNKPKHGRKDGLRTWGSARPKRKYDTLMYTVDGGEIEDEVHLSKMRPKDQGGDRELRADDDSTEDIFSPMKLGICLSVSDFLSKIAYHIQAPAASILQIAVRLPADIGRLDEYVLQMDAGN